jgi:hypothetical protein
MKEGSYQFIHIDVYGREGSSQSKTVTKKSGVKVTTTTKSRSAKEILSEQWREDGACPHINNPGEPALLYGIAPLDVLPLIDEWADQAKDAQGRNTVQKCRFTRIIDMRASTILPPLLRQNFFCTT